MALTYRHFSPSLFLSLHLCRPLPAPPPAPPSPSAPVAPTPVTTHPPPPPAGTSAQTPPPPTPWVSDHRVAVTGRRVAASATAPSHRRRRRAHQPPPPPHAAAHARARAPHAARLCGPTTAVGRVGVGEGRGQWGRALGGEGEGGRRKRWGEALARVAPVCAPRRCRPPATPPPPGRPPTTTTAGTVRSSPWCPLATALLRLATFLRCHTLPAATHTSVGAARQLPRRRARARAQPPPATTASVAAGGEGGGGAGGGGGERRGGHRTAACPTTPAARASGWVSLVGWVRRGGGGGRSGETESVGGCVGRRYRAVVTNLLGCHPARPRWPGARRPPPRGTPLPPSGA